MTLRQISHRAALAALMLFCGLALHAASTTVAEGAGGIRITVDDLTADAMQRIPPEHRHHALGLPDAVQQVTQNLYVRRALAQEAVRDGLDKDPVVAAALQIVRDRVLSDARLARIDAANKPTDAAVEAAARLAYNSAPEKFRTAAQSRARHILIQGTGDAERAAAEKLLAELKAGADFEKLAREHSQDGSAARGGDLGWFEKGRMVAEFQTAVDALQNPGDLSGLVRTQFGWHIVRLEGRREGGQRTFEEVRDQLRADAVVRLQSDGRVKEVRRLLETFKPDRAAIEAFSATHKR